MRTLSVLLLSTALLNAQSQKIDLLMDWQAAPGYDTNGGIYNIRYLAPGSIVSDYTTWPLLAAVTNSTTHSFFNVWDTQLFAISHTNPVTGLESTHGIQPIHTYAFARTNVPSTRIDTNAEPQATKQSLQIWWSGPTNWQANGGVFNVRCSGPGSIAGDYLTWPVFARITNILNTKFFNVNPTQWYSISYTNTKTGFESPEGVGPVRAQYNWQGLTNTTVRAEREYKGWNIARSR